MKEKNLDNSRRQFITKAIPACTFACLFGNGILAMAQSELPQEKQQAKHKFDQDYDKQITYRRLVSISYKNAMSIIKSLEKEMEKEKTIEFLKKHSTEMALNRSKKQAEKIPDNSLSAYVKKFRTGFEKLATLEIVEDADKAFKINITECIWASTFLEANMEDYGYALVCWADYADAEGFNPKIQLIRDQTLMQGHNCCNHRYILNS